MTVVLIINILILIREYKDIFENRVSPKYGARVCQLLATCQSVEYTIHLMNLLGY